MKDECEFTWFGQTWKVMRGKKRNDSSFGGECDVEKRLIEINISYDDETFLDYLHHELMEGAAILNACCYTREYPDELDMIVMTHQQMDVVSGTVRGAYEVIKKNIGAKNEGWTTAEKTPKKTTPLAAKRTKPKKKK